MEISAQQDHAIKDTVDLDVMDKATTNKDNMTEETTAKFTNDGTLTVDKEKLAHDAFKALFDTFRQKVRLQHELFLVRLAAWQARQAAERAVQQHVIDTRLNLQNIDLDRLQSLDDYSKFMTLNITFIKCRTKCYVLKRKNLELIDELVNLQMVIRRDHTDRLEQLDARVKEESESKEAYFLSFQRRMSEAIRIMMTEKRYY